MPLCFFGCLHILPFCRKNRYAFFLILFASSLVHAASDANVLKNLPIQSHSPSYSFSLNSFSPRVLPSPTVMRADSKKSTPTYSSFDTMSSSLSNRALESISSMALSLPEMCWISKWFELHNPTIIGENELLKRSRYSLSLLKLQQRIWDPTRFQQSLYISYVRMEGKKTCLCSWF